jgi:tRNA(adenine34) deaminase
MMTPSVFMEKALIEARQALDRGEFPVGCIIVYEDSVIASGSRQGTTGVIASETDHAEILALKQLEAYTSPVDRSKLTLYCTMEPCLMCFGAILISGIRRIVYAYEDAMGGGTRCDLSRLPALYRDGPPVTLIPHILRDESLCLFKRYFSNPLHTYWKNSLLSQYTLAATPTNPSLNDQTISR